MESSPTVCVICLEEAPLVELDCSHRFHRQCILSWARMNSMCPICRARLDYNLLEILVIEEYIQNVRTVVRRRGRERERRPDILGLISFIILVMFVAVSFGLIASFKEAP